uniref:Consortin, connexin sorting protein b n=1 Tax=Sphaeramia orbicularis TaxID=375764 RepID=A0A673BR05_9TELE
MLLLLSVKFPHGGINKVLSYLILSLQILCVLSPAGMFFSLEFTAPKSRFSVSRDGPPGPSPELLASLQSLGENNDYTLLPQSLHQIAEAYSLKEDFQWAIRFLELEKLYHERLLSNLTTLQENWGTVCTCCFFSILSPLQVFHLSLHIFLFQSSSPDGLVSILKRRRASLDGLPPPSNSGTQQNPKRKVRFSEPDDGIEQDEVGGDSCLILLLLCLVTVVISIGGTALYCTLVDTYSNICTDFTHNADFYITPLTPEAVSFTSLCVPPFHRCQGVH